MAAQKVKNPPAMQETWIRSLNQEDPLEKGMVTHPVLLPSEFHGQRSLASYSPWGCRVGHDWVTNTFISMLSLQLLGSHQTARIYLQPFLLWNSKPVSCCACLQQHHHDSKLHPSSFLLASELSSWNSNLLTVFTAYQQLSPSQYTWSKIQLPPARLTRFFFIHSINECFLSPATCWTELQGLGKSSFLLSWSLYSSGKGES